MPHLQGEATVRGRGICYGDETAGRDSMIPALLVEAFDYELLE
jgi:hypothetical protein